MIGVPSRLRLIRNAAAFDRTLRPRTPVSEAVSVTVGLPMKPLRQTVTVISVKELTDGRRTVLNGLNNSCLLICVITQDVETSSQINLHDTRHSTILSHRGPGLYNTISKYDI